MGLNPKYIFQVAILFLALVIFLGIYVVKNGLPVKWKSESAKRYFHWSLAISLLIFVLAAGIIIMLNN